MKLKALAFALALVLVLSAVPVRAQAAVSLTMPEPVLAPAALPGLSVQPQAKTYSIEMTYTGNGKAELYSTSAGARESVYFLADPDPGYRVSFEKCGYYKEQYDLKFYYIGNNVYEIVMPDGNVLLNLEFVKIETASHDVKLTVSAGGAATVDQKTAKKGESLFVTVTPAPGYSKKSVRARSAGGWNEGYYLKTVDGKDLYEIIMPDEALEILVDFTRNGPYAITPYIDVPGGSAPLCRRGCNFLFEASTGGAIPVIRPLHQCLAGNDITAIAGILNGTTNFILTKMINEQMAFADALAMAQKLGYAEQDPTADIEGHDACRKICILASLAFGKHVYPKWVYCEGITKLTLEDVMYAQNWGGEIKLIGSVKKCADGKILPMVRPALVCSNNQLSHISDVFNGIMVYGDAVDEVMFYGRGAGKLPTASAIVGDIVDVAKMTAPSISQTWEDSTDDSFIADYKDDVVSVYVRANGVSADKVSAVFGKVEFLSRENQPEGEVAFVTSAMAERSFDEKLAELGGEILGKIRVLELD